MDYFITIKDETFKFVKEVIIGRGSPFDSLLKHRNIARSHARFHLKGKHLYLTDLDSKSGTFVNGKKLQANKDYPIKPTDHILIADIELKLHFQRPKKVKPSKVKRLAKGEKSYMAPILMAICLIVPSIVHMGFDNPKDLLAITVSLSVFLLSVIIAGLYYFLSTRKLKKIKEIYIGKTGLTLHFEETNMSINFDNIDKAKIYKNIIELQAHKKEFVIHGIKNLGGLTKILKKRAKEKVKVSGEHGEFYLFLILLFILTYGYMFLDKEITKYILIAVSSINVILAIHLSFKRDLRKIIIGGKFRFFKFLLPTSIIIYGIQYFFNR